LTRFALQFDPAEIPALAARFPVTDDGPAAAAGAAAHAQGHYTRAQFLVVCAWETPRSRPRVAANGEEAVRAATHVALSSSDERVRMEALLALGGVGVPTASTLLYFAEPDRYPILDVRALASLGQRPRSGSYPVAYWLEYLSACRALAQRHGVDLRTLDKALWQYSREAAR
jgi:HEAT repeat protein